MSGSTQGQIVSLSINPGRRQPLDFVDSASFVTGHGIEGDRHYTDREDRAGYQVLLIDRETVDELEISVGEVRENVTTSGIDIAAIEPGQRLSIGDQVVLRISKACPPCSSRLRWRFRRCRRSSRAAAGCWRRWNRVVPSPSATPCSYSKSPSSGSPFSRPPDAIGLDASRSGWVTHAGSQEDTLATIDLKGKVHTVLGPVAPQDLGPTTTHEHLLIDFLCMFHRPAEASEIHRAYEPVRLENLGWGRYEPFASRDNLLLLDEDTAISEVQLYKRAGGGTIVDATTTATIVDANATTTATTGDLPALLRRHDHLRHH